MRMNRSRLARLLVALATAGAAAATIATSASAQEVIWTHRFGGEFFDLGLAVAGDESGAYVAGAATSAIPGESAFGAQDAFIRKVDPSGQPLWTDQFGTADFERIEGLALDVTGVYAAGWTRSALPGQVSSGATDAFVRKYSADGAALWTRQFGTAGHEEALGVAASDSAVYVVGYTEGGLTGSGGGGATDVFVRKLDQSGATVWTTELGGTGPDSGMGVAVRGGAVYVVGCAGWFCGSFNNADASVARLDAADGSLVWERAFGDGPFVQDEARGVAVDETGVYVGGWTQGTLDGQQSAGFLDGFVRKLDEHGNVVWTRQFGTASDERVHGMSVRSGRVYVTGVTAGALADQLSAGFDDVFVAAFDAASGADAWTLQFGSRDFESGRAIVALTDRLYVAGDGVVFGPVVFPTTLPDAFVTRIGIDVTPPAITAPSSVVADATGPTGGVVTFSVSALDDLDGEVGVTCSPPSGSTFPIGTTTVTCTASDATGNNATASFEVLLRGAAGQVDGLIALVDGYGLGKLGSSLHEKLVTVQRFLAAGKPRQAEENLAAFLAQVEAQRGKGLMQTQADDLRAAGERILAVIET